MDNEYIGDQEQFKAQDHQFIVKYKASVVMLMIVPEYLMRTAFTKTNQSQISLVNYQQKVQIFGTAFLIKGNYCLTAAHNLFLKKKPIPISNIYVYPGLVNGNVKFPKGKQKNKFIRVVERKYCPEFLQLFYDDQKRNIFDFALLKLQKNVKYDQYLQLLISDTTYFTNSQIQVIVAGYPSQKISNNCKKQKIVDQYYGRGPIKQINENLMNHKANTSEGQSGSPILLQKQNQVFVVGIHISYTIKKLLNVGINISEKNIKQINNWIMEEDLKYSVTSNYQKNIMIDKSNILDEEVSKCICFLYAKYNDKLIKIGTAFMINSNHCLTVACNLFLRIKQKWQICQNIYVYPNINSFTHYPQSNQRNGFIKISDYRCPNEFIKLSQRGQYIINFNFALLKLETKVIYDKYMTLKVDTGDEQLINQQIVMMGYPKRTIFSQMNQSYIQLFSQQGNIVKFDEYQMHYTIQGQAGYSGSPILLKSSNQVVAIHSHHSTKLNLRSGIKITNKIISYIDSWMKDMSVSLTVYRLREQQIYIQNINKKYQGAID